MPSRRYFILPTICIFLIPILSYGKTKIPLELNLLCEKKICTATLKAKKNIHINKRFMWGAEFVTQVSQNGKTLPFNCVHAAVQPSEKDMILLKKNETITHEFNLAECYELKKGTYQIKASYRATSSLLVHATLTIHITD